MSRASLAISSALPQLLRLTIEIISGAASASSHQPAYAQAGLKAQGDLGQHVRQLQLEELSISQRPPELLAIQPILPRGMEADSAAPSTPQLIP